jgi:hypothetical protein
MMRQCAAAMGRRIRIIDVPVLTPALSAYWLNLVTTVPMNLARPLVEGLRNDVITTDRRIRDLIPVPAMTYAVMVRRALDEDAAGPPASRWTTALTAPPERPAPPGIAELRDERIVHAAVSPDRLFAAVARVGGDTGWYFADALWRLRGRLDRLVGGVGMRRGRPHPTRVAAGDPIDFWRVEDVEPGRLLRLRAEMRLPGEARLEFSVTGRRGSRAGPARPVPARPAMFESLYWYSLYRRTC